ncbi:hypothetical protein T492DRAFT_1152361 [Pavlovales sp. CCMP2436]|nr:hypothetical protein T492DRAFT_1152361 [Pavlovales sp. CCMP2436]
MGRNCVCVRAAAAAAAAAAVGTALAAAAPLAAPARSTDERTEPTCSLDERTAREFVRGRWAAGAESSTDAAERESRGVRGIVERERDSHTYQWSWYQKECKNNLEGYQYCCHK